MTARKEKRSHEVTFLSTLIGEATSYSTKEAERRDPNDADVTRAVKAMSKSLLETKAGLEASSPGSDRLAENAAELAILERYQPKLMSEDEVRAAIAKIIADKPDAKLPDLMGGLKQAHAGQYDGKLASELAKAALSAPAA